jgi:hypothetical protein
VVRGLQVNKRLHANCRPALGFGDALCFH